MIQQDEGGAEMSIEQAQAFIEKVKNDEDLAKRLSEAQDNESKLEIARQEGFEFELEDVKIAKDGLTDEALADVAAANASQEGCERYSNNNLHWVLIG